MSFPVGSALPALFSFFKNSVLTDPAVPPTIVNATYPDATLLSPIPSLTHVRTGQYSATVFTTLQTASQTGYYEALAYTSDTTMDNQLSLESWNVQSAEAPADIASAVWNALTADYDTADTMGAVMNLIGTGTAFSPVPVGADGQTTLVRGSSYYDADGLALTYTLSGYPALDVGAGLAEWRALENTPQARVLAVTGDTISTTSVRFELTPAQTQVLKSGSPPTGGYSISATINGSSHLLKLPNQSLTILNSV